METQVTACVKTMCSLRHISVHCLYDRAGQVNRCDCSSHVTRRSELKVQSGLRTKVIHNLLEIQ